MLFTIAPGKRTVFTAFLLLCTLCAAAQKDTTAHNIESFFNQLPDSCFRLCNWRGEMASTGIRTLDNKNGFIAFKRKEDEPDFFQAALFKGRNNANYIAVSTRECEAFACFNPRSFFYLHRPGGWVQADAVLFSGISIRLFYTNAATAELAEKYHGYFHLNYILPQRGTVVRVEADLCDYLQEDHLEVDDRQYQQLISEKKTLYLQWERNNNRFRVIGKRNSRAVTN